MRKYKCFDCDHTWEVIFGEEEPGVKQACPMCKSLNVHRMDKKDERRGNPRELFPGKEAR